MKNNLLFDFTVDKTNNTVFVNREFAAELSMVWGAFTKQEILDQWWAPQPWVSKTKSMDFKVGGRRFYAMVSPQGEEHYSIQKFTSISPKTNLKWLSSFADKDENINAEFPTSEWNLNFSEENGTTKVAIAIKHKTLADIEMHIKMGFKEGFTMTLNELEKLLSTFKKIKQ
jgi:uncharacterized protein YndB with AHSA1/START domain